MKWSIHQLRKLQHKGIVFEEYVDVSDLAERESEIRSISPIMVKGRADMSASKIVFHLHIQGTMVLPCARTLADVNVPIDVQTDEIFLLTSDEMEDKDGNFHVMEKDSVDLEPVIEEVLLAEIPMQVFAEDTSDVALSKGQGWQVIEEQEVEEKVDPRLAGLAKFFDKNNE
ncbi:MAG: YceD family protein [Bacillaceae bacterium]